MNTTATALAVVNDSQLRKAGHGRREDGGAGEQGSTEIPGKLFSLLLLQFTFTTKI